LTVGSRNLPFLWDWVAAVRGVGKPGIKAPGTPEGVPRTATIARYRRHKKAPAIVGEALCALINSGSYARSLIWQRRSKVSV